MGVLAEGKELLRQTEESLKTLVARGAKSSEYDGVMVLTEWAKTLNAMRETATLPATVHTSSTLPFGAARSARARYGKESISRKPSGKSKVIQKSTDYPKFVKQKDALVKIAWSRSCKSEYEHKAPRHVVSTLVQALVKHGVGGRLISMEGVLPLHDSDGAEIPAYQSYLSLAWLRRDGLILQHGRQGYSLKQGTDLESAAASAWERLPPRSIT